MITRTTFEAVPTDGQETFFVIMEHESIQDFWSMYLPGETFRPVSMGMTWEIVELRPREPWSRPGPPPWPPSNGNGFGRILVKPSRFQILTDLEKINKLESLVLRVLEFPFPGPLAGESKAEMEQIRQDILKYFDSKLPLKYGD